MRWEFTPYAVPLFIGALVLVAIAFIAWQRRTVRGALYLFWLSITLNIYTIGYALELGSLDVVAVRFWLKFEYLGVPFSPVLLLCLVLAYTSHDRHLTPLMLTLLLAIPAMTMLMALSNDYHNLIWKNIHLDRSNGYTGTLFTRGMWGRIVLVGYSYLLNVSALIILLRATLRSSGLYHRQLGTILVGIVLGFGGNLAHLTGIAPDGLDLSPYGYSGAITILALGIFQYQMFDLMPVAHAQVLASMQDAILVVDARRRVVELNAAAADLIGQHRDVAVSLLLETVLPSALRPVVIHCLDHDIEDADLQLDRAGRPQFFELRIYPLHSHNNRRNNNNWQQNVQHDSVQHDPDSHNNDRLAGHLLMLRDVTGDKQAVAERERLIAELDAFAHTVAHDLKNPLMVMTGYSTALQEERCTMSAADVDEYLGVIASTGQKMANIIDELLLLAGVRRMQQVELGPLEMRPLVASAQLRLLSLINERRALILTPESWPEAMGYGPWVEEVWTNYVSNAIKYGGTPPRVTLGATVQDGNYVRFWVRDNGVGLTPEQQARLFTPFTRLRQVRVEGHGLGLSIVQRIVTRLGGQVGVESVPDQGSEFFFTLPTFFLPDN
ncbi:MAG: PAS domain-containing protein [Anaerolineae bacterium]|nr:PAS domain-containing protein [Anaerolineae bacterium]